MTDQTKIYAGSITDAISLVGYTGWGAGAHLSYTFYTNASDTGVASELLPYPQIGNSPDPTNPTYGDKFEELDGETSVVTAGFAQIAKFADVTFEQTADAAEADLGFAGLDYDTTSAAAWATPGKPASGPARAWYTNAAQIGSSAQPFGAFGDNHNDWVYGAIIHEMGHLLGLKHTFEASGLSGTDANTARFSIMSYTASKDSGRFAYEFQLYDIASLQALYGRNDNYHSGNTNYSYLDFVETNPGDATFQNRYFSIWDGGGIDKIDANGPDLEEPVVAAAFIDLRPGHFSSLGMDTGVTIADGVIDDRGVANVSIAFGAVIENANGTKYNDALVGNIYGNKLNGGDGDDIIYGSGSALRDAVLHVTDLGIDEVGSINTDDGDYRKINVGGSLTSGGAPSETEVIDILKGGNGNDLLVSGDGIGQLFGDDGNDKLWGGAGKDYLDGGAGDDLLLSGQGNDRLIGGAGSDTLDGGDGNDVIISSWNSGVGDQINGGAGSDLIMAYAGDEVNAGDGDDYIIARGGLIDGGAGNDYIESPFNYSCAVSFGIGSGHDTMVRDGWNTSWWLLGPSINIVLDGITEDDVKIVWNAEPDSGGGFQGTADWALVIKETGESLFIPSIYGTSNIDPNVSLYNVFTQISINGTGIYYYDIDMEFGSTSPYAVDLTSFNNATAPSAGDTTGTSGDDDLTGGHQDENLSGGDGNDTFHSSGGSDSFDGGNGNDTAQFYGGRSNFAASLSGDTLTLTDSTGVEGQTTLTSVESIYFISDDQSYTIGDLVGYYGTSGNDTIIATDLNNEIYGLAGNDTLNGLGGTDSLTGGSGDDIMDGGDGLDTAYYDGMSDNYTIIRHSDETVTILALNGEIEGTDTLSNIETLFFSGDDVQVCPSSEHLAQLAA